MAMTMFYDFRPVTAVQYLTLDLRSTHVVMISSTSVVKTDIMMYNTDQSLSSNNPLYKLPLIILTIDIPYLPCN